VYGEGLHLKFYPRTEDLSSFMILLEGRAMGLGMLRDLPRRRGQSTRPPVMAIIMLPIAQLMLGKVASGVDANVVEERTGIALEIHGTAACTCSYVYMHIVIFYSHMLRWVGGECVGL
jgi:hypothetical protein